MDSEEVRYRLMKLIDEYPHITQREASVALGISLGKVNYCLRALVNMGHIKLNNFRLNPEKRRYAYLLTASGVEAKARATMSFLRRKVEEYELIKLQIEVLNAELETLVQRGHISAPIFIEAASSKVKESVYVPKPESV